AGVERAQEKLHERVARRSRDLGIDEAGDNSRIALDSVLAANQRLGRLNSTLHERSRLADVQSKILTAIAQFHSAAGSSRSLLRAFGDAVKSAAGLFGDGFYAMIYQAREGQAWSVCQCSGDGRVLRCESVEPPPGGADLASLADPSQFSAANL